MLAVGGTPFNLVAADPAAREEYFAGSLAAIRELRARAARASAAVGAPGGERRLESAGADPPVRAAPPSFGSPQ